MQLCVLLKSFFSWVVVFTGCSNSVRPSLISRMLFSLLITRDSIKKDGKGKVPNGFYHSLLRPYLLRFMQRKKWSERRRSKFSLFCFVFSFSQNPLDGEFIANKLKWLRTGFYQHPENLTLWIKWTVACTHQRIISFTFSKGITVPLKDKHLLG